MSADYYLEKAAKAWCTKMTEHKVMDPILCEEFAHILEKECAAVVNHGMVRLAWCAYAALSSNETTIKPGDYGWSPEYEAILNSRRFVEKLIQQQEIHDTPADPPQKKETINFREFL